jgi:quercetin dioxygenase-like cupin family protein
VFKQIIPPNPNPSASPRAPSDQGAHEGHEWLYVIAGRLRLILGDKDFTLTAGEAAEFDTRIPHAVTNAGPEPVELLNIFGPQGERLHLRAYGTTSS